MTGAIDLFNSERGVWCIAVLVMVTALLALGAITSDTWVDVVKLMTYVLVGSKTVTTAVDSFVSKKPPSAAGPEVPQ